MAHVRREEDADQAVFVHVNVRMLSEGRGFFANVNDVVSDGTLEAEHHLRIRRRMDASGNVLVGHGEADLRHGTELLCDFFGILVLVPDLFEEASVVGEAWWSNDVRALDFRDRLELHLIGHPPSSQVSIVLCRKLFCFCCFSRSAC